MSFSYASPDQNPTDKGVELVSLATPTAAASREPEGGSEPEKSRAPQHVSDTDNHANGGGLTNYPLHRPQEVGTGELDNKAGQLPHGTSGESSLEAAEAGFHEPAKSRLHQCVDGGLGDNGQEHPRHSTGSTPAENVANNAQDPTGDPTDDPTDDPGAKEVSGHDRPRPTTGSLSEEILAAALENSSASGANGKEVVVNADHHYTSSQHSESTHLDGHTILGARIASFVLVTIACILDATKGFGNWSTATSGRLSKAELVLTCGAFLFWVYLAIKTLHEAITTKINAISATNAIKNMINAIKPIKPVKLTKTVLRGIRSNWREVLLVADGFGYAFSIAYGGATLHLAALQSSTVKYAVAATKLGLWLGRFFIFIYFVAELYRKTPTQKQDTRRTSPA